MRNDTTVISGLSSPILGARYVLPKCPACNGSGVVTDLAELKDAKDRLLCARLMEDLTDREIDKLNAELPSDLRLYVNGS